MEGEFNDGSFNGTIYDDEIKVYHGRAVNEGLKVGWKRNGQGISYKRSGQIEFDGQWKDGKPHNYGSRFYSNGSIKLIGMFKEGDLHGYGEKFDILGN